MTLLYWSMGGFRKGRINVTKGCRASGDNIHMLIRGFGLLADEKSAEEFFKMLEAAGDKFVPTKLGIGEPLQIPYSMDNAKKVWLESGTNRPYGGILFKGPSIFGSNDWNNRDNTNHSSLTIPSKLLVSNKANDALIALAKKLFIWSKGVYGYISHDSNTIYAPGFSYNTCIGGITWVNLFGKPYVNMFKRRVMESAPCKVEEFAEDCFMLLTAEKPIRANPELLEIQERVKDHLGTDAFCRLEDIPTCLTMEDLRAGRDRPNTEGYRSPDLSEYLKDSRRKKEEGLIAVVDDDGTITTYKAEPK